MNNRPNMNAIMRNAKSYDYFIGIDTGVNTGFAVWCPKTRKLVKLETVKIHAALFDILRWHQKGVKIKLRIEDPRLRSYFGNDKRGEAGVQAKQQGAGSVKRDAVVWEDFCKAYHIDYDLVHPKDVRDLNQETFRKFTGWEPTTDQHSRDAGMMVFGF